NIVQGNYIGLDISGAVALPNGNNGITILATSNNTIGGTVAAAANVVSANRANGIGVRDAYGSVTNPTTGNVIQGNIIGTSAADYTVATLGNRGDGISLG